MASQHHDPPQGATKSTPTLIFHTSRISKVYTVDLSLVALVAQMPVCSVYSTSYWIFLKHPAFCPKSGLSARYAYFGWFGILGPDFGLELSFCEENRPRWNWADEFEQKRLLRPWYHHRLLSPCDIFAGHPENLFFLATIQQMLWQPVSLLWFMTGL